MIEDIDRIRLQDIEENIKQDLKLLKDYEEELRFEADPRRLGDIRRNIQRQHESVRKYRQEYEELNKKGTSPQAQNISNLLQKQETKLDEVQKMLPLIWNIPHNRNPNFTGREEHLTRLKDALNSGQPAALTQAIHGLGGVGKTQLALEYAYRNTADYDIVWWIHSEETTTMASDYADLASELKLPEKDEADQNVVNAAVKHWLETHPAWLLVFDNVQKPEDIRTYLPQGSAGHILITSRNPSWRGTATPLDVNVLERSESIDFLLKRTGYTDKASAGALAEALGDLPLALEQAGAYMESKGRSLSDYMDMFTEHKNRLLNKVKPSTDYPDTVATTWDLAFQEVQQTSPEGADLLYLCAYLAPDNIPIELMTEGAQYLPNPLAAAVADPMDFDEAVEPLLRYSLVEKNGETLSVHRLVQAVIHNRLAENEKKKWAETAVKIINNGFPGNSHDVRNWPACVPLLPHALVAAEHAETHRVALESTGRLLNESGLFLKSRAQFTEAKKISERALAIGEAAYGPDHPTVAIYVNNLGGVLKDLGDLQGAKTNFERALAIDEAAYGPDHPTVANYVNNLGGVLKDLGDLQGAKKNLERALAIDEAAYGPDHPTVAIRVNNLGSVLQDLGDLQGAKKNFERVLAIDEAAYGPDHPDVAIDVNNLGRVLQDLGDLQGAKKNLERALAIDEAAYGPDHPTVAIRVNNLGGVLKDLGDLQGAKKNYERALAIFTKFLGEDHSNTVTVRNNIENLESQLES